MKTPIDKAGTIMARLGFNPESSDSTKAAFIKNLIKQAYGVEVSLPVQYQSPDPETFEQFTIKAIDEKLLDDKPEQMSPEQMTFDLQAPPKVG